MLAVGRTCAPFPARPDRGLVARVRLTGHLLADRRAVPPREGGRRRHARGLLLRRQQFLHLGAWRHAPRRARAFCAGASDGRSDSGRTPDWRGVCDRRDGGGAIVLIRTGFSTRWTGG